MRKFLIIIILSINSPLNSVAQIPQQQWKNIYANITPSNQPLLTPDGGFIIASVEDNSSLASNPVPKGATDIVITKTDINGIIQWKKSYGGSRGDGNGNVFFMKGNDGGYVVISSTNSNNQDIPSGNDTTFSNLWILKIDEQGTVKFSKIIQSDSTFEIALSAIHSNNKDGYLATVEVYDPHPRQHADGLLTNCTANTLSYKFIKIDNGGNLVYQKCLETDIGYIYQRFKLGEGTGSKYFLFDDGIINSNGMCNIGRYPSIAMIDDTLHYFWKKSTFQYNLPTLFYSVGEPSVLFKNNSFIIPMYDVTGCTYNNPLAIINIDTLGNLLWKNITKSRLGMLVNPVDGDSNTFFITRKLNPRFNTYTDTSMIFKLSSVNGALLAKKNVSFYNLDPSRNYKDFEEIQLFKKGQDLYFWGGISGSYYDPVKYSISYNKMVLGKLGLVNKVVGYCFVDINQNHIKDSSETIIEGLKVMAEKTNENFAYSFTDTSGRYEILTDTGTYHLSIDGKIAENFTVSPDPVSTNHSTYNFTDTINFALSPIPGKSDVSINLVSTGVARPGFKSTYLIVIKNNAGPDAANGTIKLIKDSRMSLDNSSWPPVSVKENTISWNYSNLPVLGMDTITVTLGLQPPPALNFLDTVSLKAIITSSKLQTDFTNDTAFLKQVVLNAADPNDKQEINAGNFSLKQIENQKALQYTIRFQNTGNYPTSTIIVKDTLDNNLDWKSLNTIAASHPYQFKVINENELEWDFENINLPDSLTNEKKSHGFVTYTIKPKPNLEIGQMIYNKASIYFDYNLPVITNNQQTVIYKSIDSLTQNQPVQIENLTIKGFPNPVTENSVIQINSMYNFSNIPLKIFNSAGKIIMNKQINLAEGINLIPVKLSAANTELYIVSVFVNGKRYSIKLLKGK